MTSKHYKSVPECIATVEGPQRPGRGGLDALTLAEVMQWHRIPGLGVAVIDDFQIHWAKGYGIADVETGAAVDTDTLFQAGSISKPVTAMAMLKAVQDGRFSLDDDINRIVRSWKLPDSPFTKEYPVTPRMLASHTSGLGDGLGFPGYKPTNPLPTTLQILDGQPPANTGRVFIERPPLAAFKYSGGGTTVLQLALTDVLQQPFPQIVRNDVFEPIGMSHSAFEQPLSAALDKHAARGHDENGKPRDSKWHVYPELAAAGLWTTPSDLAMFAIEVQRSVHGNSNRVLSRSIVQEMVNPVGVGDFAVGFAIERQGEGWYMQHGGGTWGFTCLLLAHKAQGYGVVIMTNASTAYPGVFKEIKERVERAYAWDSLEKPVLRTFDVRGR